MQLNWKFVMTKLLKALCQKDLTFLPFHIILWEFVNLYSKDISLKNEDFSILLFAFYSLNLSPFMHLCCFVTYIYMRWELRVLSFRREVKYLFICLSVWWGILSINQCFLNDIETDVVLVKTFCHVHYTLLASFEFRRSINNFKTIKKKNGQMLGKMF